MKPIVQEVVVKSILSRSGIPGADYCLNPYTGCSHACRYCYATFMKRYSGHTEPWGSFVDVKMNAAAVLERQARRAARGSVIISSVTDAYQPLEARYRLTRNCLEILLDHQFPVDILTKSPLVMRDMDLIQRFRDIDVGITITTNEEKMRRIFEPGAPPIESRIRTLRRLHDEGVRTYAFIGPILPMDPDVVCERIRPYADHVYIDRMNYVSKTKELHGRLDRSQWLERDYIDEIMERLRKGFGRDRVTLC